MGENNAISKIFSGIRFTLHMWYLNLPSLENNPKLVNTSQGENNHIICAIEYMGAKNSSTKILKVA